MHEIVHYIDGHTNRLGPYRHRHADIARAGAEDRNHTGEIGRQRIALHERDPRRVSGIKPADIMIAIGRVPADVRPGRSKQAQFRPHQFAGADEQDRAGLQIEEYRQIAHAILASPHSGLTGIIFYICLVQCSQREFISSLLQRNYRISASRRQGPRDACSQQRIRQGPIAVGGPGKRQRHPTNCAGRTQRGALDRSSRRAGGAKHLYPARSLRTAEEAGAAMVARQRFQRHDLARAQGVLRPRAIPRAACRHRQEISGDVCVPPSLRQGMGA